MVEGRLRQRTSGEVGPDVNPTEGPEGAARTPQLQIAGIVEFLKYTRCADVGRSFCICDYKGQNAVTCRIEVAQFCRGAPGSQPRFPGPLGSSIGPSFVGSRHGGRTKREGNGERHFDHTKGFPGEGPEDTGVAQFCTINVTAWSSFAYAALFKDKRVDVFLVQEHKLQGVKAMQKARKTCNAAGRNTRLSEADRTAKGGISGGVGVLWKQAHDIAVQDAPQGGIRVKENARVAATRLRIGDVTFVCVSVYGNVSDKSQVQRMFEEVAEGTSYYKEPVVIAGDWNVEPEEVEGWIGPGGDLQVVAPRGPTCWSSAGTARCIDFLVVNTTARRLMTRVWTEESELCTHCPVFCSFQVEGSCCINTWIRPNSRTVPAKGESVVGPQLDAGYDQVDEEIRKISKVIAFEEAEVIQQGVDRIWEAWCQKAKQELDAAVGEEGNAPGRAYEYEIVDHLGAKAPARKSEDVQNAEAIAWCRRRLIEAAGMARKQEWKEWSTKTGLQAKAKAKKHGRQCISKAAEDALQAPWDRSAEVLLELAQETGKGGEDLRRHLRKTRLQEWKDKMADSLAAGTKEAFAFIKADDFVCQEIRSKGIRQVIVDNTEVWGPLWEHKAGDKCSEARSFVKGNNVEGRCVWQPEQVREAAKSFRAGTSCTDGVPVKMYGMLSDRALKAFAGQVDVWVRSAVWPQEESKVHTVLLPKPTGGERPIALFRTAVRLACKLISAGTATWMAKQEMPACNTGKGRRAGDGVWRTQMRSFITCEKEHGEVLIDMAKAFEYVDRKVLQQKAKEEDYPKEALAAALATYGFSRRLVWQKAVSEPLQPRRGIAAGSAFATAELWLMLVGMVRDIVSKWPEVNFLVHVDDVSYGTCAGSREELADTLAVVHKEVCGLITQGCRLKLAEHKTVVIANTEGGAALIAQHIGKCAEAGVECRKLGADYMLYGNWKGSTGGSMTSGSRGRRASHGGYKEDPKKTRQRMRRAKKGVKQAHRKPRKRLTKEAGPKVWPGRLAVREARQAKAARRMARLRMLPRKGTARAHRAGISPVALYAAEHAPWDSKDLESMVKQVLEVRRCRAPAVPQRIAETAIPSDANPRVMAALAAMERWAREVWIGTRSVANTRGVVRQTGDVLQIGERRKIFAKLQFEQPEEVTTVGGPVGALVQAIRFFHLRWVTAEVFTSYEGRVYDLEAGTPAMFKAMLLQDHAKLSLEQFVDSVTERQEELRRKGQDTVESFIGEVDWQCVGGVLQARKTPDVAKKVLGALAWGVLPTKQWLSLHGWEVEVLCERCGDTEDTAHTLCGCSEDPNSEARENRAAWAEVLKAAAVIKPQEGDAVEGQESDDYIHEFMRGFPVQDIGSLKLVAGVPVFTDGSAINVGTPWARAAAAVVQVVPGEGERAWSMAVPLDFPQSAVCAEHYAIGIVLEVAGRGLEDLQDRTGGESSQGRHPRSEGEEGLTIVADCKAVVLAGQSVTMPGSEKFKYGGIWRSEHHRKIKEILKVQAHATEAQARKEGWHELWDGNQRADEVAKRARKDVKGVTREVIQSLRKKAKGLAALCQKAGTALWAEMKAPKVHVLKNKDRAQEIGVRRHTPIFCNGAWCCTTCGKAFRKAASGSIVAYGRCSGSWELAKLAHPTHTLHEGTWGGPVGRDKPIVFCSQCGAYASTRIQALGEVCDGHGKGRPGQVKALKAGRHPKAKEPINDIRKWPPPTCQGQADRRGEGGNLGPGCSSRPEEASVPAAGPPARSFDPGRAFDRREGNGEGTESLRGEDARQQGAYEGREGSDEAVAEDDLGVLWSGFEGFEGEEV